MIIKEVMEQTESQFLPITVPISSREDSDMKLFTKVINQGIDSHLEGFTKSKFERKGDRYILDFHKSEIPILVRRLEEIAEQTGDENALSWAEDIKNYKDEDSEETGSDETPVEYPQGKQDTPANYNSYMEKSKTDGGIFERFSPNQLNALLETLMRNKKTFDKMYNALATDGFVPLNENANYDIKRAIIIEMVKNGQLAKHMLQTLVESKQIVIEGDYTGAMDWDDIEKQNREVRAQKGLAPVSDDNPELNGAESSDDFENGGEADVNPEDENPEVADVNPEDMGSEVDSEILNQIKDVGGARSELTQVSDQLNNNRVEFSKLAEMAGFTKSDGSGDSRAYGQYISDPMNYSKMDDNQKEVADWYKDLVQQQKILMGRKNQLSTKLAPPVKVPVEEPEEWEAAMEGKKSELQLRAGSQGKIFESRLRKMESYKKVALLEFLENDPKMIDDQDYGDMAALTGICEADLIAMQIEYDQTINEVAYPVIGGQDVHGENKKNETKQLNRDMKNASKSQETTEEKVRDFKASKFEAEKQNKNIAQTDKEDQNRGQHSLVGVLNAQDGSQEKRYAAQANGDTNLRDKDAVDANVGDGKVYGSTGVTKVGDDLIKKGESQEEEHENEPIYNKETVPTTGGKKLKVNEDIDRMKSLFNYSASKYANPRTKNSHDKIFEQQLNSFRTLSESVDISDRPSQQQLAEMKETDFNGKKAKTDGASYFDHEGKKLGECDTVKEAVNGQSYKDSMASVGYTADKKGNYMDARSHANVRKDTYAKADKARAGYDIEHLDEGSSTGQKCTKCGHAIYHTKKGDSCMCNDAPSPESTNPLQKTLDRQKKLAGVKTEAKNLQLKHTKGTQLKTGTKEELVDEAKNLQLKHTKGIQLKTGTKVEDESKKKI